MVFIFIGATVGLLGWAGLRPWVEGWREVCTSLLYSGQELNELTIRRKCENDGVMSLYQGRVIDRFTIVLQTKLAVCRLRSVFAYT